MKLHYSFSVQLEFLPLLIAALCISWDGFWRAGIYIMWISTRLMMCSRATCACITADGNRYTVD